MKSPLLALLCGALLTGCATSSIQSRKQERSSAYMALTPDQKALVDQGKIQVGMNPDAVFIAWGPPAETLENETSQGHTTIWIYHGQWMEESRYWTFREVPGKEAPMLKRHLESDYFPRQYIRAEILFQNGTVAQWRTLPRPAP